MDGVERSIDRRPLLPLIFEARATRSLRLWRRIFVYYVRHAERVWNRPDLRVAVRDELVRAKTEIVECLSGSLGDALVEYESDPVVGRLEVEARFPEMVDYVDLFRMADRVFVGSRRIERGADARAIRLKATQALRRPAQIVSETPGLEASPQRPLQSGP